MRFATAVRAASLALLVGGLFGGAVPARAQEDPGSPEDAAAWRQSSTERFTVLYRVGGEVARDEVLARADATYEALSQALATRVQGPLVIRLHPDIESFLVANPLAVEADGVIGGSRRSRREAELILGDDEAMVARDALRSELARLLVLEGSDGRMPDVFAAGLARALVPFGGREASGVARLRDAWSRGAVPDWGALTEPDAAYLDPPLVAPTARSIATYLVEREGLGGWLVTMERLRAGAPWREALAVGFGAPPEALAADWARWLPGYLDGGWRHSPLYAPDLAAARASLAAGDPDAVERALRPALPLIALDDAAAAEEVEALLAAAGFAAGGSRELGLALEALEEGAYEVASAHAATAQDQLAAVGSGAVGAAREAAARAERGRRATERLAAAQRLPRWRAAEARTLAVAAAGDFGRLGNQPAVERATAVAEEADRRLQPAGRLLALCGGVMLLWNVRTRRRQSLREP